MAIQVRVYGRPDNVCLRCRATKQWLKRHGIPYQFINVDQDAYAEEFIRSLGALEVPVVTWNETGDSDSGSGWWSGHRIPKLEELAEMLADDDAA